MRFLFIFLISFSLLFAQANDEFASFEDEFSQNSVHASWDPLKAYNVQMTNFNDFVYMKVLGPVAKGYRYVVNKPIREGVSNIFYNLQFPVRFINNILQLKFKNAFEETARFAINSTFGLVGFVDLATKEGGLKKHDEDFGQTLGFYGVSDDLHIVLPLLGPSNLRDTIGFVVDGFANPLAYAQKEQWDGFEDDNTYLYLSVYQTINEYSLHINEYENVRKDALNLYIVLKNIYEQRRKKLIEE